MTIPKIPARYLKVVSPCVIAFFMSFIMSFITTLRAIGFVDDFFTIWMSAWGLSWIIACPSLFVVIPFSQKIIGLLVESD